MVMPGASPGNSSSIDVNETLNHAKHADAAPSGAVRILLEGMIAGRQKMKRVRIAIGTAHLLLFSIDASAWTLVVTALAALSWNPVAAQTPATTATTIAGAQPGQDTINTDRPGIADGSTVIGRGRLQLETGFQKEVRRVDAGTSQTEFVPTLARWGLGSGWEARFESNTVTHVSAPGPEGGVIRTSGLAPVSFGVKFQMQGAAGAHRPSLGTILRIVPSSGTDTLHTSRATGDLRLAADWNLTPRISLNPNAGVAVSEYKEGRFAAALFALTLNYFNETKTINPFVDVGMQAPETPAAGSSIIIDGGVAWLPGRRLQIDVSAGAGRRGRTPPRRFFSVGISLLFRASERR